MSYLLSTGLKLQTQIISSEPEPEPEPGLLPRRFSLVRNLLWWKIHHKTKPAQLINTEGGGLTPQCKTMRFLSDQSLRLWGVWGLFKETSST